MYKLYVIPGSHACRAGMLMLEHKALSYRTIELVTLTHSALVRVHGFDSGGQMRAAGGRRPPSLRLGDMLGTVPALADGERRISTNYRIARHLDEQHPEPRLVPEDPQERARVEEVEQWANRELQMEARRLVFSAVLRDPGGMCRAAGDGRLGHLLYRHYLTRRAVNPWIGRLVFATRPSEDGELLRNLSAMLDTIDASIADGTIGGAQPNVADFMIAPSLALILYRPDVMPLFDGRPALELVDRLLPEPGARVLS
jgi:glutathione S-transferase